MKKRIIISSLVTVLFSLILVTSAFITLLNINEIQRTKDSLAIYNNFFVDKYVENEEIDLDKFKIKGKHVRFTVIKKDGSVIFDTEGEVQENHKERDEIKEAFIKGQGTSVRFSNTLAVNLVYYATKINDTTVVRSSVPSSVVEVILSGDLKYYIFIVIVVAFLALGLSIKLARIILYPIKELEGATSKILSGDLNKRARVYNDDEIGALARSFNKMAEELQIKINDSYDKQNKLEAILESMDSGVIAIDNHGEIMLINPYVKKLFELKGDIIGEQISNCIREYDLLEFIKSIPEIHSKEIKLLRPVERDIKIKKAPIINSNNATIGIVITLSDITDIKKLENMRSQFVTNVTHELKTPLTSIKGFSETLKFVDDENIRNKFLDIINKEADRLGRLINDILVLSNIENMHLLKNEEFKPKEVLDEVIAIISNEAMEKNIKINFVNKFNKKINGDRDKFYQLSINLIDNAVKYSKENGEIIIITDEIKDKFVLKVSDNGIGIPEYDLPRIFERFYRVDKSRATKGTGLGLAIVKHIVKLFNGEISVESILDKGTTFTVKLKNIQKSL